MKIYWIRNKDGKTETKNITNVVSNINWSGSTSQVARTAEIAVLNAPYDKNITSLKINIAVGDIIKLIEDDECIFIGQIKTKEKASAPGTVSYYAVDFMQHLLSSEGVYNFKNKTPEDITKRICADIEVKTGEIVKTGKNIKKMIIDGDNFYVIIMKAYTKVSKETGKKYICRMNGTKLTVVVKGTVVKKFILSDNENITDTQYQETIENAVNVVKIYDDEKKQIGEIRDEESIKKYGIFQKIYTKEKGIDAKVAAKHMLTGVEKTVSLEAIEGNIECISGNGVQVYDAATRLNGLFWIESDTHTWENNVHTMSLEISFKNLMDSQE